MLHRFLRILRAPGQFSRTSVCGCFYMVELIADWYGREFQICFGDAIQAVFATNTGRDSNTWREQVASNWWVRNDVVGGLDAACSSGSTNNLKFSTVLGEVKTRPRATQTSCGKQLDYLLEPGWRRSRRSLLKLLCGGNWWLLMLCWTEESSLKFVTILIYFFFSLQFKNKLFLLNCLQVNKVYRLDS